MKFPVFTRHQLVVVKPSVFHLGTTGQNYFYAMEFVEGETLEKLIRCSGRLEVKLALEIANQVAGGMAAVTDGSGINATKRDWQHRRREITSQQR